MDSDSKWSKTDLAEFKEMPFSRDGPPHKSAIFIFFQRFPVFCIIFPFPGVEKIGKNRYNIKNLLVINKKNKNGATNYGNKTKTKRFYRYRR